jgi:glycosyltransferase involved in cell wall biosynthesis
MKRILYLFVTMPVGGAEMLCFEFLKGLDRSRFEAVTCCIDGKGSLGLEIERAGFDVVSLGRMKSRRFEPGTVAAVSRLLKWRQIDIIHTNMYHASLYGRLGAVLLGRERPRIVTAVHSLYTERKRHRLFVNRVLNRFTDRIIAVSQAVKDDVVRYEKVSPDMVAVLPLGADFERLDVGLTAEAAKRRLGLSPSDQVLGTVGRLVEAKGHRYMLQALALLLERGLSFKLLIAGGGRLVEDLRRQAAETGIQDHVLLVGERRDIPEIYRAMDLYVMASVSEAASIALLEAMAVGLPCVVTAVGGMMDLVDGGRCARVIPPADAAALADAIESLHRSPAEGSALGQAARKRARENFGRETLVRGLQTVYDSLF